LLKFAKHFAQTLTREEEIKVDSSRLLEQKLQYLSAVSAIKRAQMGCGIRVQPQTQRSDFKKRSSFLASSSTLSMYSGPQLHRSSSNGEHPTIMRTSSLTSRSKTATINRQTCSGFP
jgi:hypothetical protein